MAPEVILDFLKTIFPWVIAILGYFLHRLIADMDVDIKELKASQSRVQMSTTRMEAAFAVFKEMMEKLSENQFQEIQTLRECVSKIEKQNVINLDAKRQVRRKR